VAAHPRREWTARWPAANLNSGRRRLHAAVVLRCISGDGERRNVYGSARGCLRRHRFAPALPQDDESSAGKPRQRTTWPSKPWQRSGG
jgi:hypothetical protein